MKYLLSLLVVSFLVSGNVDAANPKRKIVRAVDSSWDEAKDTYLNDMTDYYRLEDEVELNKYLLNQTNDRIKRLTASLGEYSKISQDSDTKIQTPAQQEADRKAKELKKQQARAAGLTNLIKNLSADLDKKSQAEAERRLREIQTKSEYLNVVAKEQNIRKARKLREEMNDPQTVEKLNNEARAKAKKKIKSKHPEADVFYVMRDRSPRNTASTVSPTAVSPTTVQPSTDQPPTLDQPGNTTPVTATGAVAGTGAPEYDFAKESEPNNIPRENAPNLPVTPSTSSSEDETAGEPQNTPAVVTPVTVSHEQGKTACDQAQVEVVQAIMKDPKNAGIFTKMVKLATVKTAYLLKKENKRTLEEYANKLQPINKDDQKFKESITQLYQAYGVSADKNILDKFGNDKKYNYYKKSLRLTNENASAVLLYASSRVSDAEKAKPISLTTSDAAAIWAQQKIFESKKLALGSVEGNLMNFSTQVYGLLDPERNLTAEKLLARYDRGSKDLQKTILAAINNLKDDQKKCFVDGAGAPCGPQSVSLGSTSLQAIQCKLAQYASGAGPDPVSEPVTAVTGSVPVTAVGATTATATATTVAPVKPVTAVAPIAPQLKLDFDKTTAEDEVIYISTKK